MQTRNGVLASQPGVIMTQAITPVQELAERDGAGGLVFKRWIGCWLDLLVLLAIVFAPTLILRSYDTDQGAAIMGASMIVGVLYFPVCESIWGRTIGKLVTGLKVVDAQGRTPNVGRVIVRTLFRLLEVNPALLGGIPAGICVIATKRKQRLGDLVAGTYVLDAGEVARAVDIDGLRVAQEFA